MCYFLIKLHPKPSVLNFEQKNIFRSFEQFNLIKFLIIERHSPFFLSNAVRFLVLDSLEMTKRIRFGVYENQEN